MYFLSNIHTHTTYCDGSNTAEEFVQKAIEKGFGSLGFSGHAYLYFGEEWSMSPGNTKKYIEEIKMLKEKYKDKIEIYAGVETDYYSNITKEQSLKDGFEFMIGSVHFVKDEKEDKFYCVDNTLEEIDKGITEYKNGGGKGFIERYYETIPVMLDEQKPDVLGHLDLIKKLNKGNRLFNEEEKWYRDIMESVIDKIKNRNVIVEVNTGGMSRGYTDFPYPSKFALEMMLKKKVPIMLNSDSHSVETLDYYFPEALEVIKNIGFKEIYIFRQGKFEEVAL